MNTVRDPVIEHPALEAAPARREPLSSLEPHDAFVARHIGTSAEDQANMLGALGYASRQALIDAIVPAAIRRPETGAHSMALPEALPEA
ncbi:MAG: hypothetical protein ACR2GP_15105, partial [Burkholderiaceae bacterium]